MDEKKWNKSLGLWAATALPFVALVLPLFGRADLSAFITEESAGIAEWFTLLGTLIGSALAFYGRLRAKTKLTR